MTRVARYETRVMQTMATALYEKYVGIRFSHYTHLIEPNNTIG